MTEISLQEVEHFALAEENARMVERIKFLEAALENAQIESSRVVAANAALRDVISGAAKPIDSLTFDRYQADAYTTAVYKDPNYPWLGLAEETGELLGKRAKWLRKDKEFLPLGEVAKEMGDVLWMLSAIATDLGFTLSSIAQLNIDKLRGRKENNTIHGDGDNR